MGLADGPDLVRLLVVSQVPPPVHGQTLMTLRSLELLRAAGHEVDLVDRRFSRSLDAVGRPSVRKVGAAVGLAARLVRVVVARRPDAAIVFATTRTGSFVVDVVLVRLLRAFRVPVLLSVHSVGFRALASRGRLGRVGVTSLLGAAARVVCLGPSLAADVLPFVDETALALVPNTPVVDPTEVVPAARTGDGDVVLWLSNVLPGKGAEAFARIAARLAPELPDASFRLVGPLVDAALSEEVTRAADDLPLRGRLVVAGTAQGDAKWAELRGAACLAFTSELDEAQPLTIVEAMACGVPVVAFARGGIVDVVVDGVTGFLVEPGDEVAFAARISSLLADPELRRRLGRAARDHYDRRHSPRAHLEGWRRALTGLPARGVPDDRL